MRDVAALVIALSASLAAQSPPSELRFDVVSIKPHTGPPLASVPTSPPGALRRLNVTVQALVLYAYQLNDYQLLDMPAWGSADRFDVEAKAGRAVSAADMRLMVRSLLEERFALRTHHEERQMTMYSLVVANANGRLGPEHQTQHGRLQVERERTRQCAGGVGERSWMQ